MIVVTALKCNIGGDWSGNPKTWAVVTVPATSLCLLQTCQLLQMFNGIQFWSSHRKNSVLFFSNLLLYSSTTFWWYKSGICAKALLREWLQTPLCTPHSFLQLYTPRWVARWPRESTYKEWIPVITLFEHCTPLYHHDFTHFITASEGAHSDYTGPNYPSTRSDVALCPHQLPPHSAVDFDDPSTPGELW